MWKAVLFDLDGTLADTLKSLHYCTNRALKYCGLPGHPMEACLLYTSGINIRFRDGGNLKKGRYQEARGW